MWKKKPLTTFSNIANRHVCFSPTWSNSQMTVIDISLSITATHRTALVWTLMRTDTNSGSVISRHTLSITLTMCRWTRSWRSVTTKRKSGRAKEKINKHVENCTQKLAPKARSSLYLFFWAKSAYDSFFYWCRCFTVKIFVLWAFS